MKNLLLYLIVLAGIVGLLPAVVYSQWVPPGSGNNFNAASLSKEGLADPSAFSIEKHLLAPERHARSSMTFLAGGGYIEVTITQAWRDAAWVDSLKDSISYQPHALQAALLHQIWNGTEWYDSAQTIYNIDSSGITASYVTQTWNGTAWVNVGQDFLTHDSNRRLTGEIRQTWDGNAWVNLTQGV